MMTQIRLDLANVFFFLSKEKIIVNVIFLCE